MTFTIEYPLKSANGRNWPGIVVIHPDAPFKAAVVAQEYYEARAKLNPLTLLRTRLSKSARRDMEITGHEIEVQAAVAFYDADEGAYRAREVAQMHRGYDGLFKHMTAAQIEARMLDERETARRFVSANRSKIAAQV